MWYLINSLKLLSENPQPPPPKRSTPPKIQEMQAPSLPFLPTLKIFQGPLQKGGDSMLMVQKSLRKQQKKPTKHGEKHPLYHHPYSKQTLLHINYWLCWELFPEIMVMFLWYYVIFLKLLKSACAYTITEMQKYWKCTES